MIDQNNFDTYRNELNELLADWAASHGFSARAASIRYTSTDFDIKIEVHELDNDGHQKLSGWDNEFVDSLRKKFPTLPEQALGCKFRTAKGGVAILTGIKSESAYPYVLDLVTVRGIHKPNVRCKIDFLTALV